MIEVKNIKKSFNSGSFVLNDLSMIIEEGDLIRITGSNGCGKSTLLKIMCGLMKPDSGSVIYEKYKNEIGAIIENPTFIENDTILYNLKFLYDLRNNFDEEKVKSLCQQFDLDLYNKSVMKKYSVGMRQKVGFIQAIMEDQKIIYLDEPTRGMDENGVNQFYSMIRQLHSENKTIVICTHEKLDGIHFQKEFEIKNGTIFNKI